MIVKSACMCGRRRRTTEECGEAREARAGKQLRACVARRRRACTAGRPLRRGAGPVAPVESRERSAGGCTCFYTKCAKHYTHHNTLRSVRAARRPLKGSRAGRRSSILRLHTRYSVTLCLSSALSSSMSLLVAPLSPLTTTPGRPISTVHLFNHRVLSLSPVSSFVSLN